jgi:hypothetical protein
MDKRSFLMYSISGGRLLSDLIKPMSTIKALNFFSEAVLSNGREATEAEDILVITRARESNSSAFLLVGPVNSSDKLEYLT